MIFYGITSVSDSKLRELGVDAETAYVECGLVVSEVADFYVEPAELHVDDDLPKYGTVICYRLKDGEPSLMAGDYEEFKQMLHDCYNKR